MRYYSYDHDENENIQVTHFRREKYSYLPEVRGIDCFTAIVGFDVYIISQWRIIRSKMAKENRQKSRTPPPLAAILFTQVTFKLVPCLFQPL